MDHAYQKFNIVSLENVLNCRDQFKELVQQCVKIRTFAMTDAYFHYKEKYESTKWRKVPWDRFQTPKHSIIGYLAWHNKLVTMDMRVGLGIDRYWFLR